MNYHVCNSLSNVTAEGQRDRDKDRVTEKQKANAAKLTTRESMWRHLVFTALLQLFGRQEIFQTKTMENVNRFQKEKNLIGFKVLGEARRIILYQADYVLMKTNCKDCKVYLKKNSQFGSGKKRENINMWQEEYILILLFS